MRRGTEGGLCLRWSQALYILSVSIVLQCHRDDGKKKH